MWHQASGKRQRDTEHLSAKGSPAACAFSGSAMAVAVGRRACRATAPRAAKHPDGRESLMEAMMQPDAASREIHHLIASDRVEGTQVRSTDGSTIGTIERVMIDKIPGNVAYAVLSFNGPVAVGQRRLPIPW